ncbi:hypothetical protein Athai_07750 [Actinocatenispora thailandica]|uniref:SseB protein N-terminal domain-containing protein n=1 Tax=Actinocatenispora thailandica TaxID=227318 RepID=A0A7R7DKY7_9ACTN|nr:hypothetical protein [Actinocatenispora thailandica]BCJ33272.1 hypothetical protein Athai_07750 [Actinocatenispora thailandica]
MDLGEDEQPPAWQPANDVERLMLDALVRNHSQDYFRLVATAPLYLPVFLGDANTDRQRVVVKTISDAEHLLVFTSVRGLTGYVEAGYTPDSRPDGYAQTSYEELAARRPEPEWRLAINPGQPIDAYVEIDAVMHAALGDIQIPLADELIDPAGVGERAPIPADFVPANEAERAIEYGLVHRDIDVAIDALVVADVLVATAEQARPDAALTDPDFPWQLESIDDIPSICVFTSQQRLTEVLPPDTPAYPTTLVKLALAWPDEDCQLMVNIGSAIELAFEGAMIPSFVSWASDLMERVESGEYAEPADARLADAAGTGVVVGGHAVDAVMPPAIGDLAPPVGAAAPVADPVLFQKVLTPEQVQAYLRGGDRRVAGFVHPYESVRELTTPQQLYTGLGLLHDRTPFRVDDEEVHVLRWTAYCPELYRLAIGGRDERTRAAVDGWVVAPAPFLGSGIAPGSAGAPEFKVDSVELPHGAQLCRLDRYGRQSEVANFDADTGTWAAAVGRPSWTEDVR